MLLNILIFSILLSRVTYFAQSEPLQFSALSEQDDGDNLRGLHGDQLAVPQYMPAINTLKA
ncbi:unnamed protein product, partial [Allacma fusca]